MGAHTTFLQCVKDSKIYTIKQTVECRGGKEGFKYGPPIMWVHASQLIYIGDYKCAATNIFHGDGIPSILPVESVDVDSTRTQKNPTHRRL